VQTVKAIFECRCFRLALSGKNIFMLFLQIHANSKNYAASESLVAVSIVESRHESRAATQAHDTRKAQWQRLASGLPAHRIFAHRSILLTGPGQQAMGHL
jgi:hypothetical protein